VKKLNSTRYKITVAAISFMMAMRINITVIELCIEQIYRVGCFINF